jgi:hypothetical protein
MMTNINALCEKSKVLPIQEVACWPLVPEFAGSHPAKAVGFLWQKKKSSARLPSEGK